MKMGGYEVVVVVVVVTTVVCVAGAIDSCPIVVKGSTTCFCTALDEASQPRPGGVEAMLLEQTGGATGARRAL